MLVASMLHIVKLYRNQELRPADKVIDFLHWTYDNLLLSQYAILLFTGQEYIKALKEQAQETLIVLFEGVKIRHGIYVIYQVGVHPILTAKMFCKNLCLQQMTIS